MSISSRKLLLVSLAALGVGLGLAMQAAPASAAARCVWYGPGSGPMPPCYHPQPSAGVNNCAQTVGQPSACKNYRPSAGGRSSYGGVVVAPGAKNIGVGVMAGNCRKTAFGIVCSDERLKTDVRKVGSLANGLTLYRYRYLWSPRVYVGVMAQEARRLLPQAVVEMANGFLAVDYDKVGVPMMTRKAWRSRGRWGVALAA